ncbi:hypothetical protein HGO34_06685 [Agrobacterium vitis]|uniref:Uncharacterized protein n=1 Tax=Agrobacterium vitis TaxID=373 RepID=A0AAE4WBW7_AGRVI|nr:hypothetical protein [Agrobacterium vitis]MCF1499341.1 hypothetical protein [Allorhizobium sp. Av2]MCM2439407.1 hypothetical protein [Agrobacterium vitis]MUZ57689.1 hypothetical protein [Agrobacterium vitis]
MPNSTTIPDTYFIGLTQQSSAGGLARLAAGAAEILPAFKVYPGRASFAEFVRPIEQRLDGDPHVEKVAIQPVLGRYGASQELSVGLEILASEGFNAAALAETVFRQARAARQLDAFVGRVLLPGEWTDNARPGLTVLFREPRRIGELGSLRAEIGSFPGEGWPIDGFTTIPIRGGMVGMVKGLRYVFLPEISIRWDAALYERLAGEPEEMEIILIDQATKIGRLRKPLLQHSYIEDAYLNWFDVIVGGIENYDEIIGRLAATVAVHVRNHASMTRKPFSEILQLDSAAVLQDRLFHIRASAMMLGQTTASRAHDLQSTSRTGIVEPKVSENVQAYG